MLYCIQMYTDSKDSNSSSCLHSKHFSHCHFLCLHLHWSTTLNTYTPLEGRMFYSDAWSRGLQSMFAWPHVLETIIVFVVEDILHLVMDRRQEGSRGKRPCKMPRLVTHFLWLGLTCWSFHNLQNIPVTWEQVYHTRAHGRHFTVWLHKP